MHIKVNGKQIDIGDALRAHVEDKLTAGVKKYSSRTVDAVVTFSRDAHMYKCDCSVNLSTGLHAQAQASAGDVYAAFDQAAERLEKQLRRYKRRLKDHHARRAEPIIRAEYAERVIAAADDDESNEPSDLQPIIIAETRTNIPSLTVGEAVMQMEVADHAFLVFQNEAHGGVNIVYRRPDGNVGWVDPANRV